MGLIIQREMEIKVSEESSKLQCFKQTASSTSLTVMARGVDQTRTAGSFATLTLQLMGVPSAPVLGACHSMSAPFRRSGMPAMFSISAGFLQRRHHRWNVHPKIRSLPLGDRYQGI